MKKFSSIIVGTILTLIMIAGLSFAAQPILADDHDYDVYELREHYSGHGGHEEDEGMEEGGELLGWGTVAAMGGAVVLLPLRRNASKLMKAFPQEKNMIKSILKFFSNTHIWIGIVALGLSGVHGTLLFLHEGEFEFDIVLGILSFSLMIIAALFGMKLAKNKSLKNIRSIHIGLLAGAIIIAAVHILGS